MKLNQHQVEVIQEKTGLAPIPAQTAASSGLAEHFGDHSFYVDSEGVYVFEEAESPAADGADRESVIAVKIATVEPSGDDGEAMVRGIDPTITTLTVELD